MKINANTTHGRVLIALRAGRMDGSQIRDRVGSAHYFLTVLDEEKDCLWLPNDTLVNLVSELHSFAQALAGDRMGEIYDQADEVAA